MPRCRRPRVRRDHLACRDDHDSVDVAFDRHHLERERARNTVAIAVEGDGLVLVHRGSRTDHAGIKPMDREAAMRAACSSAKRSPISNGPKSD